MTKVTSRKKERRKISFVRHMIPPYIMGQFVETKLPTSGNGATHTIVLVFFFFVHKKTAESDSRPFT